MYVLSHCRKTESDSGPGPTRLHVGSTQTLGVSSHPKDQTQNPSPRDRLVGWKFDFNVLRKGVRRERGEGREGGREKGEIERGRERLTLTHSNRFRPTAPFSGEQETH